VTYRNPRLRQQIGRERISQKRTQCGILPLAAIYWPCCAMMGWRRRSMSQLDVFTTPELKGPVLHNAIRTLYQGIRSISQILSYHNLFKSACNHKARYDLIHVDVPPFDCILRRFSYWVLTTWLCQKSAHILLSTQIRVSPDNSDESVQKRT